MDDDAALRPALDQEYFADLPAPLRVEVVDEVASTNAELVARAKAGAPHGLVLAAEHQTSGRGRLDRAWQVPRGRALTFSILIRPVDLPISSWTLIPLMTGVALHAALVDRVPEVMLKWPNDVLVGDHKLAGILVERVETDLGPAAVIGIGVNVNQSAQEMPGDVGTSLRVELDDTFDRNQVLAQVLGSFRALLPLLEDPEVLRAVYTDVCATIGRVVDVHLPAGEKVRGEVLDIDQYGALVLSTGEGTFTAHAGDVVHVRAAG